MIDNNERLLIEVREYLYSRDVQFPSQELKPFVEKTIYLFERLIDVFPDRDEAYNNGFDIGYQEGKEDGYDSGYNEGYTEGQSV